MGSFDNFNSPASNDFTSPPAPPSSKLGLIGLALCILGTIVFCGPMAIAFISGLTGTTDALGTTGLTVVSLISYCGVFLTLVGAVVGGVSLAREESKVYGIISIVVAVLIFCSCSVLFVIGLGASGAL